MILMILAWSLMVWARMLVILMIRARVLALLMLLARIFLILVKAIMLGLCFGDSDDFAYGFC